MSSSSNTNDFDKNNHGSSMPISPSSLLISPQSSTMMIKCKMRQNNSTDSLIGRQIFSREDDHGGDCVCSSNNSVDSMMNSIENDDDDHNEISIVKNYPQEEHDKLEIKPINTEITASMSDEMKAITTNISQDVDKNIAIDNDKTIIESLNCEIRTYQDIITSLTDKNNIYRMKEVGHLKLIADLENKVDNVNIIENELEIKNKMVNDLMMKVDILEDELNVHQVKTAELGQKVLQLEVELNESKTETKTLEMLLSHSRCVSSSMTKNNGKIINNTGDSKKMKERNTSSSLFLSLESELKATKKREKDLQAQLKGIIDYNKRDDDVIMESLSASQQEAIVYLTGEVESLRTKLDEYQESEGTQRKEHQVQLDLIETLERENKSFASDILKKDHVVDRVQEELSMKLGQNACLRDEVAELEYKITKLEDVVVDLKDIIKEKDNEHQRLISDMKEMENIQIELEVANQSLHVEKRSDESVVTIELNGGPIELNGSHCLDDNELSHDDSISVGRDVASNRLMVLKKALKRNYENKLRLFKKEMKKKDTEMEEYIQKSQEEIDMLKNDLKIERFNRISQESLFHHDIENLSDTVKEREQEMFLVKRKLCAMMAERENGGQKWDARLSETLIDGVGATLQMFESIKWTFDDDDDDAVEKDTKIAQNKPKKRLYPSMSLSSKSFG